MTADELEYDTRGNRVIARGSVEIYYNDNALTADEVIYDQGANTLTARGNVQLKQPDGAIVRGERLDATADFAEAFIESLSVVGKDDTRIVARRAIRRDGNVTEFEDGKFTPCKNDPGKPPLWCVTAQRIVHDQKEATITYQDARFELFGVPILYMPYFQHPDPSVKRKSGFLFPEFGSSTNLGFMAEIPYYFALAPNYDFLFNPMYTAKQGILWQGEWRHKVRWGDITGTYNIKLAGIDQSDTDEKLVRKDLQSEWRGSLETRGRFSLSSWWNFGWNIVAESDDTFRRFYKLDNILQTDRVNTVFLNGLSGRNYFSLSMQHYGGLLLNDTPVNESRVHPLLDYNYIFADPVLGGELSANINAISLSQDVAFTDALGVRRFVDGSTYNRFTASVGWKRRFVDPLGQTYTPFFAARGDIIRVKDVVDPITQLLVDDNSVTRGVWSAGLLYAYPWAMSTSTAAHSIEPLGQIIARNQTVEQRRLPNVDARSVINDDTNLFEVDKLSGYDRIETGVRANYGLQYTYQSHNGGGARFLVGQSKHLSGDNIYRDPGFDANGVRLYSPVSGLEKSRSDYVLAAYLAPLANFRGVAQARYDDETNKLRSLDTFATFNYGLLTAQAGYSYSAAVPAMNLLADQREIQGLLALKLTDRWSVAGQLRYDIDEKRSMQEVLQLRYGDECLVVTASYIQTNVLNVARDITPDRTLMLRFELKYLGEYRYKTNVLNQVFSDNQPE